MDNECSDNRSSIVYTSISRLQKLENQSKMHSEWFFKYICQFWHHVEILDSPRRIESNFYEYNGKVKLNDSFVLLLSFIVSTIHKYLQSCDL